MVKKKGWSRLGRLGSTALGTSSRYLGGLLLDGFRRGDARSEARRQRLEQAGAEMAATLGELKGAAMKLGQILSSDPELLPPEMAKALAVLQREAPPMPFSRVLQILEEEWGPERMAQVAEIEETPLGAASLGQVHGARLKDGRILAVKVQYPGIKDSLESDLAQLQRILKLSPIANLRKQAEAFVTELRDRFLMESDYIQELDNLRTGAEILDFVPGLVVPEGMEAFTTERVLTMERLDGKPLSDAFLDLDQEARNRIGETLMLTYSGGLHRHGFLHGDTHPGNFMLLEDGRLGLLDFGCVRSFDMETADDILNVLVVTWEQRYDDLPAAYSKLGYSRGRVVQKPEHLREFGEIILAPFICEGPFDFAQWPMKEQLQRFYIDHIGFTRLMPPPNLVFFLRVLVGLRALLHQGGCRIEARKLAMNLAGERLGYSPVGGEA